VVTTGCSFTGSQDGRRTLHLEKHWTRTYNQIIYPVQCWETSYGRNKRRF